MCVDKFNIIKGDNENNIIVDGCINCPFMYSDYDDYALGFNTTDICTLALRMDLPDYFINARDASDDNIDIKTPSWCPLDKKLIIVKK